MDHLGDGWRSRHWHAAVVVFLLASRSRWSFFFLGSVSTTNTSQLLKGSSLRPDFLLQILDSVADVAQNLCTSKHSTQAFVNVPEGISSTKNSITASNFEVWELHHDCCIGTKTAHFQKGNEESAQQQWLSLWLNPISHNDLLPHWLPTNLGQTQFLPSFPVCTG